MSETRRFVVVAMLVVSQVVGPQLFAADRRVDRVTRADHQLASPGGHEPRLNPFLDDGVAFPNPHEFATLPEPRRQDPEPLAVPVSRSLRQLLESEEDKAALAAALRKYLVEDDSSGQDGSTADNGTDSESPNGGGFDQELVQRGQRFFQQGCTQCHDAERATSKMKTYAAWLATVKRMAAKEDADIPANQHVAIATYLASLNPANRPPPRDDADRGENGAAAATNGAAGSPTAVGEVTLPPYTLSGTLSPVWRGTDPEVENKGFFPDAWLGVEWRPESSPVSGVVTACTSCHGTNNGLGVELVEAAVTLDLCHLITRTPPSERECSRWEARLKAGRFIVPFGDFSSRVHPGALRTVSPPLMYNMGRRVGSTGPLQPVLPMPYSDEGVQLHLSHKWSDVTTTLDTYAVNGLQQGGPGVFFFSRSYRDNNSNVAVGSRATVSRGGWQIGGSVAAGELQADSGPLQAYKLGGGDISYRHEDVFRAYYEYAIRVEDSLPQPDTESIVYGNLVEMELLLLSDPKISFLARYDTLDHRGFLGEADTERFTYGLNFVLYGGSFLAVDHEHWVFHDRNSINILGLRWTVAF